MAEASNNQTQASGASSGSSVTAPKKNGRPRWEPPPLDRVEAMAQRGLSLPQIAAALGICLATLKRRRRESADFAAAIERGRAQGIVALANAGYDLAIVGKDGPMIRFLLSTVGGYRETTRLEVGIEGEIGVKGDVHHSVDIVSAIKRFELVLSTNGARTHAREEIEADSRPSRPAIPAEASEEGEP